MRRLLRILQLVLALQRFDESLLSEILSIRDVIDNSVNQQENPPQIVGNKAGLLLLGGLNADLALGWDAALAHCAVKRPLEKWCRRRHSSTKC